MPLKAFISYAHDNRDDLKDLLKYLKPLDEETIVRSVCKTGRALIVHEACRTGGYGGELAAVIAGSEAFDYLDAPIVRLAGRDIPIPYNRTLEYHSVPQVEAIAEAARDLAKARV